MDGLCDWSNINIWGKLRRHTLDFRSTIHVKKLQGFSGLHDTKSEKDLNGEKQLIYVSQWDDGAQIEFFHQRVNGALMESIFNGCKDSQLKPLKLTLSAYSSSCFFVCVEFQVFIKKKNYITIAVNETIKSYNKQILF